jgi:hypothetical protein
VLGALAGAGVGLAELDWMRHQWLEATASTAATNEQQRKLDARLSPGLARASIAEAPHDTHSLADLAAIAAQLW